MLLTLTTLDGKVDAKHLAECLRDDGAKLYGSAQCHYCTEQLDKFEESSNIIPYVNCDIQECRTIKAYPSWLIKGQIYEGKRGLSELAYLSGCDIKV